MSPAYLLALVPILFLVWIAATYNRFIKKRRLADEAWSGISIQLKRRHDLIPNLVETVKGYASHEQDTLSMIAKLRGAAMAGLAAGPSAGLAQAENGLTGALGRLFMVAEQYPDLKANAGFIALQGSLKEAEEQIQMARRYYNGTVREYMIQLESFPSLIVGKMFKFPTLSFFELEEESEGAAPKISF